MNYTKDELQDVAYKLEGLIIYPYHDHYYVIREIIPNATEEECENILEYLSEARIMGCCTSCGRYTHPSDLDYDDNCEECLNLEENEEE